MRLSKFAQVFHVEFPVVDNFHFQILIFLVFLHNILNKMVNIGCELLLVFVKLVIVYFEFADSFPGCVNFILEFLDIA